MSDKHHCEHCQEEGTFCSGIPGVLARVDGGKLLKGSHHYVTHCEFCRRFPSNVEAMYALHREGIADDEDLFYITGAPYFWQSEQPRAWIQTISGRQFNFIEPSPESVDIEDIAMALSRIPRFGAHTKKGKPFYSVAQHSLFVMNQLPAELKMAGLLHDSVEAYTTDLVRPLKKLWPEFKIIESRILYAITEALGLDMVDFFHPAIKQADKVALATEKRDLMATPLYECVWEPLPEPVPLPAIMSQVTKNAYNDFMRAYRSLRVQ